MREFDLKREAGAPRGEDVLFTRRHVAVLVVTVAALVVLILGAIRWNWGLLQLSALFFGLAIAAGPIGGLSLDDTARSFIQGAQDMTYAGLVVGLARGSLVILRDANVIDTLTHAMAAVVGRWSSSISVVGIYLMQNLLHFIVPSGSGQAAVSMPILAPLGDLVGITRQTNVLAYQLGNGLTNVFIPTQGYFMAALGILKIPWEKWVRWLLPLLLIWLAVGMAAVDHRPGHSSRAVLISSISSGSLTHAAHWFRINNKGAIKMKNTIVKGLAVLAVLGLVACAGERPKPAMVYYHGQTPQDVYFEVVGYTPEEIEFKIRVNFKLAYMYHLILEDNKPLAEGRHVTVLSVENSYRLIMKAKKGVRL